MSTSTATTTNSRDVIEVDLIGLVAGVSVVAIILLVVLIVALAILVRNKLRSKPHDRSGAYIVPEGTPSPFDSVHRTPDLPIDGARPTNASNANGYENKAVSNGELRQNPLAEPGIYSGMNPSVSLVNIPPQYDSYPSNRLTTSTQSLHYSSNDQRELKSFYSKLYEKLGDTTHENRGRPLYLCKRNDYPKLSNYFDIIGKSRMGDWLVRPRPNVPNRPKSKKRSNKKRPAPKPNPQPTGVNSYEGRTNGGFLLGMPGTGGFIATPFGAASRMPSSYMTRNSLENAENLAYTEQQRYTSLPRDINRHAGGSGGSRGGVQITHRESGGAADRGRGIDERVYAAVVRKNSKKGADEAPVIMDRKNPNRRERFFNITEETSHAHSPTTRAQPNTTKQEQDKGGGDTRTGGADVRTGGGGGGGRGGKGGGAVVGHRERSGSTSTVKSLGITDQFKFLDQYETEEERF